MNGKIAIGAALAGAFVLGASVVAYSSAQQSRAPEAADEAPTDDIATSFSDLEEDEIRDIVRNYLLTNPEIIIEAVNVYSLRQREMAEAQTLESARANLTKLINPKTSYIAGKNPEKAKVAVIELYDYHCGFCKRSAPLIKEMTERDEDVKVVFRELPILREESDYAAEVSLAARDQGKFLELHFAMMAASGVLTPDRVESIAKEQGVDLSKLEKARQNNKIPAAISSNHEMAAQMGIEGTPAFIVASLNGEYIEFINGFRAQELVEKIEAAKKAAG